MAIIATLDNTLQQGDSEGFKFWCKKYSVPGDTTSPLINQYDFTGAVARMQMRTSYAATSAAVDISSILTTGDRIILDNTDCSVEVVLTAETMAKVKAGVYVYDIECTFADGTVTKLVKGSNTVEAEVTK
jgi:hypothetical protein